MQKVMHWFKLDTVAANPHASEHLYTDFAIDKQQCLLVILLGDDHLRNVGNQRRRQMAEDLFNER